MSFQKMEFGHFKVLKSVSIGRFTEVYEVVSTRNVDEGTSYLLKRYLPDNPKALQCAMRERRILKRLATEYSRLHFLPTIYQSFFLQSAPILVHTKGSGFSLSDVLNCFFPLSEKKAAFYCSEIICALSQLHALQIVHLDLRPLTVLLTYTGHVMISGFDWSHDLLKDQIDFNPEEQVSSLEFMAPEVASMGEIAQEADIWSLGATMAKMVSNGVRVDSMSLIEQAKLGIWRIEEFEQLSEPLQKFLSACLEADQLKRETIEVLKSHEFFQGVNWEAVEQRSQEPPYHSTEIWAHLREKKESSSTSRTHRESSMDETKQEATEERICCDLYGVMLEHTRSDEEGWMNEEIDKLFDADFFNAVASDNEEDE